VSNRIDQIDSELTALATQRPTRHVGRNDRCTPDADQTEESVGRQRIFRRDDEVVAVCGKPTQ
jgi:hypothetical protein